MMSQMLAAIVYVGCATDATHPDGLHAVSVDLASGAMTLESSYAVANAIYQARTADGRWLYSCEAHGLVAYAADGAKLVESDRLVLTGCPCVCHVSLSADGKTLFWADYLAGKAGAVAVADGRFGRRVTYAHAGDGPNLPRQDKAHCHQAMPTPDGRGFCVVDLGLDAVMTYPVPDFTATAPAETTTHVFRSAPLGAGPRHLTFHPNGRLAFLAFELKNRVASLAWDDAKGFVQLDTLPTLASGDDGRGDNRDLVAAVRLSPDLRHVIVSNRGEESLVAYAYDAATGKLTLKARSPLTGSWPRDFIFLSETLALVTMERSGEVHTLRYDPERATFTILKTLGGLYRPVSALGARAVATGGVL